MYKYKLGTQVQGAEYIQGNLVSIMEGIIIKRKKWSGENWYTIGNYKWNGDYHTEVYLENELMEIKHEQDDSKRVGYRIL